MTKEQKKRYKELKKKKEKKEYYHTDALLETDCNWNICFGLRSNGKSYAFKKEVLLKDALDARDEKDIDKKCRFFYLRRYSEDVTPFAVLKYLEDMCIIPEGGTESPIMELSEGQYNGFDVNNRKIYAVYRDDDGKIIDRCHVGYAFSLGEAERIKSQSYSDTRNLVVEEFIATSKPYLCAHEPEFLENIASTVDRRRGTTKVYLIGNSNDRDNLYFRYFGLNGVKKQKPGTIDVYEKIKDYDEDTGEPVIVKFAVEYCENLVKSTEGIFFGRGAKNNSGEWLSDVQPKMHQEEADECECLYEMFVEYHELKYYCKLLLNKNEDGYFWYVRPWSRTIKPGVRVVSDVISTDPMTTANFVPLFQAEKKFFDLLQNGKVFYCDDLTGTEFKRACKFFFSNKIYNEG